MQRVRRLKSVVAASIALGGAAEATAESASLIRDATHLVDCMKAFDADCAAALTYTEVFEVQGVPRDQLVQAVANLYKKLTSIDARYTQFEIEQPSSVFTSDGLTYAFVPYVSMLEVPARSGLRQRGFFIGVSSDNGDTWTFVEGSSATPQSIVAIIPSYKGQPPIPPASTEQVAPPP